MFEYGELLAEPLYYIMYNSGIPRQCMIPLLHYDAGSWAQTWLRTYDYVIRFAFYYDIYYFLYDTFI